MAKNKQQIRVVSGLLKGRALGYPATSDLRPTMNRTKSSVFESLQNDIREAVFVDLFAAAGGMGIEAISRGASFVHFVERDRSALECLRANLGLLGIDSGRYRVHASDVVAFLRSRALETIAADIIFADPPYDYGEVPLLLELLGKIAYPQTTLIIFEHDVKTEIETRDDLTRTKAKRFGQTCVSFFVAVGGTE